MGVVTHVLRIQMSVRGVWIIKPSLASKPGGTVLFSRRFPTVEKRLKRSCESTDLYRPIPLDGDLCNEVTLHCSTANDEFVEERDSLRIDFHWPIFELFGGNLWPVLCLQKNGLLFVAVVTFEPENSQRPPLIKIPGIPSAVSLLEGMMEVVFSSLTASSIKSDQVTSNSQQIADLYQYICMAAPFGTPTDTNPSNLKLQLQFRKAMSMPKEKVPSWRPAVYKGSSRLFLRIREEVRAIQYDRPDASDTWQVYGSLFCKAELEGHPDVLISLTMPPGYAHIDHLMVHPCVQSADTEPLVMSPGNDESVSTRNIRFSAPLETFTLCHYQVTSLLIPIRGYYQMKGDKNVELLIQLKLHESVRNNFEFCEVHIPLYNRGPIDKIDNLVPASANVSISSDRKSLVWNIGQRFPTKSLEASLGTTVTFSEMSFDEEKDKTVDTKFCVEQNCYCELNFKISDYTLSGCFVEPRSITTFPSIKYKLTLAREFISSSYRIWNSHGDALIMPSIEDTQNFISNQTDDITT